MILLEFHNKIIEDTIITKWKAYTETQKGEAVEAVIADFDGVLFHLVSDANNRALLTISMSIKCWAQLQQHGVSELLTKHYGKYEASPENGYNYTICVNLAELTEKDVASVARSISLVKRNALSAPFYKAFEAIESKKAFPISEITYRDEEAVYIKTDSDRCTVIFNIQFKDQDDVILAKVFLQEYAEAKRTLGQAPSVSYSQKEPPSELRGVKNLRVGAGNGFVSFVLFSNHTQGGKRDATIDNIQTFRNYLHYHIKCSKAVLHTRMRNRVRNFLQVLNRAKAEIQSTEKKTFAGKTFKRADDPQGQQSLEYNI
jgi:actin related protein 2/3 complex subunit 2